MEATVIDDAAEQRFHAIMAWLHCPSRHDDKPQRKHMVNEAITLLQKFPLLASAKYEKRGMGPLERQYWVDTPGHMHYDYSVLYLLAYCGATKEQIEYVYDLHPNNNYNSIIRSAEFIRILEGYSTSDVASFLLEKNPALACLGDLKKFHQHHSTVPKPHGTFPFHVAILRYMGHGIAQSEAEREKWLMLAQTLIQIYPCCDEDTLKWALNAQCPDPVLELILQNLPEPITTFGDGGGTVDLIISLRGAHWLSRILLPQLEHFATVHGFDTPDAFTFWMESMARSAPNLQSLSLELSSSWLQLDSAALSSLQQVLTSCPRLEKIAFANKGGVDDSLLVEAICKALASRKTPIQCLRLEGFTIRNDSTLSSMMACGTECLELGRMKMEISSLPFVEQDMITSYSRLKALSMTYIAATKNPELIKDILQHITRATKSLKRLEFCPDDSSPVLDVTTQVVDLIRGGGQLEHLALPSRKLQVDASQISETLRNNTSIQVFGICYSKKKDGQGKPILLGPIWRRIKYYTQLNGYGRKAAQDPTSSKRDLVQLLLTIPEKGNTVQRRMSFHYELLQGNPAIWSS